MKPIFEPFIKQNIEKQICIVFNRSDFISISQFTTILLIHQLLRLTGMTGLSTGNALTRRLDTFHISCPLPLEHRGPCKFKFNSLQNKYLGKGLSCNSSSVGIKVSSRSVTGSPKKVLGWKGMGQDIRSLGRFCGAQTLFAWDLDRN